MPEDRIINEALFYDKGCIFKGFYDARQAECFEGTHVVPYENARAFDVAEVFHSRYLELYSYLFQFAEDFETACGPSRIAVTVAPGPVTRPEDDPGEAGKKMGRCEQAARKGYPARPCFIDTVLKADRMIQKIPLTYYQ
jgi:hypothetical protein